MQLILLILGIVGLSINEQFHGQSTISWALIAIFVVMTLIQVLVIGFVGKKALNQHARARNRRGF